MADNQSSEYRFARDVSPTAPKPGFHLATISYQRGDHVTILWVVEGAMNNTIGILGNRTDFERTSLLRFSLQGSLIEALNGLYPLPSERAMVLNFYHPEREEQSPIGVESAVTVFSSLRTAGRPDADSAAVSYVMNGSESDDGADRVLAAITGYQRGWAFEQVVTAGACALWVLEKRPPSGRQVSLTVEQDVGASPGRFADVTGDVTFSNTVMSAT